MTDNPGQEPATPAGEEDVLVCRSRLVRTAVKESGLKQVVLANRVGITAKHMSQMMTGGIDVNIGMGERILAELGQSLELRLASPGDADG